MDPGPDPPLVPWPDSLRRGVGAFELRGARVAAGGELLPHARAFAAELAELSGLPVSAAGSPPAGAGHIELVLDEADTRITIGDRVHVAGPDVHGVARGTALLLQALAVDRAGARWPRLELTDTPAAPFRALMVDVARRPHPIGELERLVELCRLYGVRFLQLHLSDDPAWTFPSRAFPELGGRNERGIACYGRDELRGLVAFADARGVTLIPELDLPGHSGAMRRAAPARFDPAGLGNVNVATGPVFDALDTLVGELCEVFASAPYVHVGGDEVEGFARVFEHYRNDPWARARGVRDARGLFDAFLAAMADSVEARGRRTLAWEGHRPAAAGLRERVAMVAWENESYPMGELLADGFDVVSAPFCPLYVLAPEVDGGTDVTPEFLYRRWDARTVGRYEGVPRSIERCELERVEERGPGELLGAMVCSWENRAAFQLGALRPLLPAFAERLASPTAAERGYADFARRAARVDRRIAPLLAPGAARHDGR